MNVLAKWFWPGLLTVALLSFLAIWLASDRIATDVASRTVHALQESGVSWADINIDGRDITLSGSAHTESLRSGADTVAGAVYGVRIVDNRTALIAKQAPYIFKAALMSGDSGPVINLSGFVPNVETRARLNEAAKVAIPDAEIVDDLEFARGASPDYANHALFAVQQLSGLTEGTIAFSDGDLSVKGQASTNAAFEQTNANLTDRRPDGLTLVEQDLRPPVVTPYTWSVLKIDGTLTISGSSPSRQDAQQTRDAIQSRFKNLRLTDGSEMAGGAPGALRAYQSYGLDLLGTLSEGRLTLTGNDLSVEGTARSVAAYRTAQSLLAGGKPAGLTISKAELRPAVVTPYTWSLQKAGSVVTASGYVPDEDAREELLNAIRISMPDARVKDALRIAGGAPDGQAEVQAGALAALQNLSDGTVSASGTNVDIRGMAVNSDAYDTVATQLSNALPAGFSISRATIAPPQKTGAYLFVATKSDAGIKLTGMVPDAAAREALARRSGEDGSAPIVDDLQFAGGAPDGFSDAAGFAMDSLEYFETGTVRVENNTIILNGTARSVESYQALTGTLKDQLPDGYSLNSDAVKPSRLPSYEWKALQQGGELVLSGYVPDKSLRKALLEQAGTVTGSKVVDRLELAAGAPDGFAQATQAALNALGGLTDGEVELSGQQWVLRGKAPNSTARNAVEQRFASGFSGDGTKIRSLITVAASEPAEQSERANRDPVAPEPSTRTQVDPSPADIQTDTTQSGSTTSNASAMDGQSEQGKDAAPPACPADFSRILDNETIRFATDKAIIKESSFPLLDRIARNLAECGDKSIEVSGHTDNRGAPAYNQALSEKRAQAVVDYLGKKAGIAGQLTARGYGETQPRAPNDTPENLARNRRIEFRLIP